MREPDLKKIQYCGYSNPKNKEELQFEILGLQTAIYEAKKRIATLKQSECLVDIKIKEDSYDSNDSK